MRRTGGSPLTAVSLAAVVGAVWHEAHGGREAIHRALEVQRCELRVTVGGRLQDRVSDTGDREDAEIRFIGDCECRDFLVDMLVEANRWLAAHHGRLHNPPGAVRAHLRTRACGDWIRRRRVEMGAQARTDRIRAGARARGLPDEYHRALLEYLVDEAGVMAPLESDDALAARLTARAAAEFGGSDSEHRRSVVTGLRVVEAHCRTGPRVNIGSTANPEYVTWWERYVERPLGRRPRRYDLALTVRHEKAPDLVDEVAHRVAEAAAGLSAPTDADVLTILRVARSLHPDSVRQAVGTAVDELVARGALPSDAARAFLSDRERVGRAVEALAALA